LTVTRPICIGVISDTHAGDRLFRLPPRLPEIFSACDFILHAGDVGQWWVLDALAAIRPVIAVHGNDDSLQSYQHLPFQQLVKVGAHTIYLSHSHHPDRATEFANRQDDAWGPKLDRIAAQAANAGGDIFVYGHTHIPMCVVHNGVLLVNPGAMASPNLTTRQAVRSVCLLRFEGEGLPTVTHIDVDSGQPYTPEIDWDAGFKAAAARFAHSVLTPDAVPVWSKMFHVIMNQLWADTPDSNRAFQRAIRVANDAMRPVWEGEKQSVSAADLRQLVDLIRPLPEFPAELIAQLEATFEADL
jgi:putative phosphoesterase